MLAVGLLAGEEPVELLGSSLLDILWMCCVAIALVLAPLLLLPLFLFCAAASFALRCGLDYRRCFRGRRDDLSRRCCVAR